jgi:hypothetical protein
MSNKPGGSEAIKNRLRFQQKRKALKAIKRIVKYKIAKTASRFRPFEKKEGIVGNRTEHL